MTRRLSVLLCCLFLAGCGHKIDSIKKSSFIIVLLALTAPAVLRRGKFTDIAEKG